MYVAVDDVRLFFDVEGCGLTVHGTTMVTRPTLVLLHGGPGADHSLFKPEFSAIADIAQLVEPEGSVSGSPLSRRPSSRS